MHLVRNHDTQNVEKRNLPLSLLPLDLRSVPISLNEQQQRVYEVLKEHSGKNGHLKIGILVPH